ncbi:MAG: hypothetical protein ACRDKV_00595 [Solirubrobacterales bacterium]
MSRRLVSGLLAALAALAIGLSLLTGYAKRAIFDSDQFANRATAALDDQAVRDELAARVTDDLVLKADEDLIGLRPLIQGAVAGLVGESAFKSLFRAAVKDVHAAVFNQDENTVTLTLADAGTLVEGAVQALDPKLARQVGGDSSTPVLEISPPAAVTDAIVKLHELSPLPLLLLLLAALLMVAALWASPDPRETVVHSGTAIAVVGILFVVAYRLAREELLGMVEDPLERSAAEGVWDAFLGELQTALLLLAGAGAVLAAAAASLIRPVEIARPLRRAFEAVATVPESPRRRVLRAIGLIAAGVVVIAAHETFLELVVLALGAYLIYAGLTEILRIAAPAAGEAVEEADETRRRLVTIAIAAAAALLLIGGTGTAYVAAGGLSENEPEQGGCNGSEALCDRPLDEVVFGGAHNAMSAASEPGWLFANHQSGVDDQLERGVRALLWDTHYGIKTPSGKVKTDLGEISSSERQKYVEEIGEPAVDAALRIRNRIVEGDGKRGIYLCHRFCELGATSLAAGLEKVSDFLVANPHEVVIIVNEDYVKPRAYVRAVKRAGLADMVYRGATGPWPTLGEMIDSGQRLVLLAENKGGGEPWYHPAYDGIMQETPYSFHKAGELTDPGKLPASCKPNRGGREGSLLLLNHWIDTSPAPRPSNAEKVNAREALLERARRCRKARGQRANVVAIDFHRTGDLRGVVEELNRPGH